MTSIVYEASQRKKKNNKKNKQVLFVNRRKKNVALVAFLLSQPVRHSKTKIIILSYLQLQFIGELSFMQSFFNLRKKKEIYFW